ncbi:G1/S-specific B-type cyclin Cig2 [Lathyrus oleraceus]|uniref:G1/S-specific B-type cyclin Cig2 n=1 Tax=Pisum sativum TaxID=3888 RepID=A0A9D5GXI7_PEA|nr:G1/S-specific B-type cyclin Cig2 [Pisum sativum]
MASNSNATNTLLSICYNHGSLQLLDQRKLPLESVYLEIRDSNDGWNVIRDMVVRGAPVIAIVATLSGYKDAATKLKEIILKVDATTSEARGVFQAYVEAFEIMLEDDVASNKAIRTYGSKFIQNHTEKQKLSVLTHCNTGSLATAGYGTALGVIRALNSGGVLERAYCTETRPFNQGSRLTAYELVHEKTPATLIADSAAAALMQAGHVAATCSRFYHRFGFVGSWRLLQLMMVLLQDYGYHLYWKRELSEGPWGSMEQVTAGGTKCKKVQANCRCHFSSDGKLPASSGHEKQAITWYIDSLKQKVMMQETMRLMGIIDREIA